MISTFLINLDRDADRLAHMRAQGQRLGLAFTRFAAVRGADLPETLKPYFAGVETLSPGEIGCYASHLALMQRIAANELAAPALILEDDIKLPADFPALIESILKALPADWDIVRLTNTAKRATIDVAPLIGDRKLVRYASVPGSTGAYLISAAGARKFLAPGVRTLPVDQDLRRVWAWGLNTFGVTPTPIQADIFESSSIDAMAPEGLRRAKARLARMRRGRSAESGARHAWNRKQFGFAAWASAETVSALVALAPKRARPALLARAGAWLGGLARRGVGA